MGITDNVMFDYENLPHYEYLLGDCRCKGLQTLSIFVNHTFSYNSIQSTISAPSREPFHQLSHSIQYSPALPPVQNDL